MIVVCAVAVFPEHVERSFLDPEYSFAEYFQLGSRRNIRPIKNGLYQYSNLSEGADRVGGQLRGDKECPFSGVTKSGRVWRKVPESDARSVVQRLCVCVWGGYLRQAVWVSACRGALARFHP